MSDLLEDVNRGLHRFVDGIGGALGVDMRDDKEIAASSVVVGRAMSSVGALVAGAPIQKMLSAPTRGPWTITAKESGGVTLGNGVEAIDCKDRAFAEKVLRELTAIQSSNRGRGR